MTLAAEFPNLPRAMLGRSALILWLFALVCLPFRADSAQEQPPATTSALPARQMVVLKNGEVISGEVHLQAERIIVLGNDCELTLQTRDVDFVCDSLDEAYRTMQLRAAGGRIDDHLNLADWCLRHDLLGDAGSEIAASMAIDPRNARLMLLDRQLQLAIEESGKEKPTVPSSSKLALPASPEELERMVRCLPMGTVESFTSTIQPMLLNYCATAGCHGPSGSSKYTLLRQSLGKQPLARITQRNLYNTLQWIDHEKPEESKLLKAAAEPHGIVGAMPAATLDFSKDQELTAWAMQVGQGVKSPPAFAASPVIAEPSSPRGRGYLASKGSIYSPPGSIGSAVAPAAPPTAKAVISGAARVVPTSRPNAPVVKPQRAAPIAVDTGSAGALAPAVRPTVPAASRSGDEIPNADEVLR